MRSRAVLVVLVVAMLVSMMVVPIAAIGQETNESAESDEEGNETTSVVADIDDDVRVLNYSYSDSQGVFSVTLENRGDRSSSVTLTELVDTSRDDNSGSFGVEVVRISPGETVEVSVDVQRDNSGVAGLMLVTQKSLESGSGVFLKDGDSGGLIEGAATWDDVRTGVGVAIAGSIGVILLVSWFVVRRQQRDDLEEVSIS